MITKGGCNVYSNIIMDHKLRNKLCTFTAVTKSSLIRVEIILTCQICLCVSMSLCFVALCPECLALRPSTHKAEYQAMDTIRICYILAWQCLHTTVNTYV